MSNRKSAKILFLEKMAKYTSVPSHCEGGWNVPMLESLEKQNMVERFRVDVTKNWHGVTVRRTRWRLTQKGKDAIGFVEEPEVEPTPLTDRED